MHTDVGTDGFDSSRLESYNCSQKGRGVQGVPEN